MKEDKEMSWMEICNITTRNQKYRLDDGAFLLPGHSATVSEEEGRKFLRLYPKDIITKDQYKAHNIVGSTILNQELERLRTANAALQAELYASRNKSEVVDKEKDKQELEDVSRQSLEAKAINLGLVKGTDFRFNTPIEKLKQIIADKESA